MGCNSSVPRQDSNAPGAITDRPSANLVQHLVVDDIEDHLEIQHTLGEGNYGRVVQALDKVNGSTHALKIIELNKKADRDALRNELSLLRRIQHPNIVRVVASFEDSSNMYMLMELCTGGELWDKVKKDRVEFSEVEVKKVIRKTLSAICYMHNEGMCHRDLKLENFLFESKEPDAEIKICDFGLSMEFHGQSMTQRLGTIEYLAPEVIREDYTNKCDMWAIGCICYELLVGKTPFVDPKGDNQQTMINIIRCETPFKEERWAKLSKRCRAFCELLLEEDPNKRWSADQALRHPWLKMDEAQVLHNRKASQGNVAKYAAENFRQYKEQPKVKQAALMAVAACTVGDHTRSRGLSYSGTGGSSLTAEDVASEEIPSPRKAFDIMDRNKHGTITLDEFCLSMAEAGMPEAEARELFSKVDQDQNNKIHYLEFLAATLSSTNLEDSMLKASFNLLDRDRNGEITTENLLGLFGTSFNKKAGVKAVKEMIKAVDVNHSGTITYDEYVLMMRAGDKAEAESKSIQVDIT